MVNPAFGRRIGIVLIISSILLVSAIGYLYITSPRAEMPSIVGVLHVEGPIVATKDADLITSLINQAAQNSSVKAVVVRIDSPGGFSELVEQIYLDLIELKKSKPVVACVTSALSGGYYIAVAADYIYAHPTSMVGNVGVIGVNPPTLIPSEYVLESGSRKVTGFSNLLFPYNLSHALESFASAVEASRGDRIRVPRNELRRGTIYLGSEALAVGLVDEMGSLQKAAERAAEMAKLKEFVVADLSPAVGSSAQVSAKWNQTGFEWAGIDTETLNRINPPPAIYYLYLPSRAIAQSRGTVSGTAEASGSFTTGLSPGKGTVLVDLSHGNMVSEWELGILAAELAERGMVLTFASTWTDIEAGLENASGLVVAAPTKPYTSNESEGIEKFVEDGRILLLLSDPAIEYLQVPALLGPANSLANRFGLSFAKGYLYDEEEYFGIYRNIYVRQFANTSMTANLKTMVLFTATYIHSMGNQAAWTSRDTYSSATERKGSYSPIAVVEGKGTVFAVGDITFLVEPYCYVEDNYNLILNIVSALANVRIQG